MTIVNRYGVGGVNGDCIFGHGAVAVVDVIVIWIVVLILVAIRKVEKLTEVVAVGVLGKQL